MRKGFDSLRPIGNYAAAIARLNYYFVGRYLKNLTSDEARALLAAGVAIVLIHEGKGDRASFGAFQAIDEAVDDVQRARALDTPGGCAIVTAIDYDAQPNDLPAIIAHFAAKKDALAREGYRSAGYGNGLALGMLLDRGLIDVAYLAGSAGWTGSERFDRWHIKQHPTVRSVDLGFDIDPCDAIDGDIGAWAPASATPATPDEMTVAVGNFTEQARLLQTLLKARGFYDGALDGDWGPLSHAALQHWRGSKP